MKLEVRGIKWDSHLMIQDEKNFKWILKRFHVKSGVVRAKLNLIKPRIITIKISSTDFRYLPYQIKVKVDKTTDLSMEIRQHITPAFKKKLQDKADEKNRRAWSKSEEERFTRDPLP